ncbi:MAG: IPT/TIG domain-containing protein [Acidobacteria bacterium]|nr:IPT/TIG domain-containing protein [Acidobacteriota bacterium]
MNAQTSSGIRYIYDEAGRLVGVIDPGGDSAAYTYDSVGNLLSISRRSSSQVSIMEFTPDGGPEGQTVTIYGTAFSATAGQNTVTFNGVNATVISATVNELKVSVPAGATTGPIAVTSPAGSATSGAVFTASSSSGPPAITGFTPTVGAAGTAVTLTGTNFDPVIVNNKVRFNEFRTSINSASATSIGTSAPPTGSGRIGVTTPRGKATSSTDFFIPPQPYTAADVEVTGRMEIGQSKTASITAANKIGMVLFDAAAGQRISLKMTGINVSSAVSILRPDGGVLVTQSVSTSSGQFIEPQLLPTSGTYTIITDPSGTATGSITFNLYAVPPDVTASITSYGAPSTVTLTAPGQNAKVTFSGTSGQRISLGTTAPTNRYPSGAATGDFMIYKPDGTAIPGTGSLGNFLLTVDLPVTGTYTAFINPAAAHTGDVSLTLYDVVDIDGTIIPGGAAVPVSITAPGQNAKLRFGGVAGQRVSLNVNGVTVYPSSVSVLNPDGSTLKSPTTVGTGSGTFIDTLTLPATGSYTIFHDPSGASVGNATFTLYEVPGDVTGVIVAGGAGVTISTTATGQNGRLTFDGISGQQVSLRATGVTTPVSTISILKPDGSVLASRSVSSSSAFIDATTLPANGTYTVLFNPYEMYTGSATLTLYDVVHTAGTITPGGSSVTTSNSVPGQNNRLTFTGAAGQRVSLLVSGVSYAGGDGSTHYVSVDKPDGTSLTSPVSFNGSGGFVDTLTLPAAGAYTITVDPSNSNTGSSSVTLYDVPSDVAGSTTIGASAVNVATTVPGQNAKLTFAGTSGQQVTVRVTNNNMNVDVRLLKPDGSYLNNKGSTAPSFDLNTTTLPITGTYTISINPQGAATGGLSVSVTNP